MNVKKFATEVFNLPVYRFGKTSFEKNPTKNARRIRFIKINLQYYYIPY